MLCNWWEQHNGLRVGHKRKRSLWIERKFQEFKFRPFTLREIYKVIDNLDNNKAPGPGYINAWALKSGKYALGTHLQIIFNDCIQEKVFPTILKDAHIAPIFKKGDVSVWTNCRPISVTPTFAKVFERLLLNQLVKYDKNLRSRTKNNSVSNLESRLLMLCFILLKK